MSQPSLSEKNLMAARPKIPTSFSNKSSKSYQPLDSKIISFTDVNGEKRSFPLICKEFSLKINTFIYYEPFLVEHHSISQQEYNVWVMDCKRYESFLANIVELPYFRFWSTVIFNVEVNEAVESYLNCATRPYSLHPLLKNNEIKPILSNIHILILKFFSRILLAKETEENYLTESYHSELFTSYKHIMDVSKVLDLIQLYGYGCHTEMIAELLRPYIQKQINIIREDLGFFFDELTSFFHFREEISLEMNKDFFKIIFNVLNVIFSLNKLLLIEPQLANVYQKHGIMEKLLDFYSKYFPHAEHGISLMFEKKQISEILFKFLRNQITLTQASFLLMFHHLIRLIFVVPLTSNSINDNFSIFENLINFLNQIASNRSFFLDYFSKFLFEKEFETLINDKDLNEQLSIRDVLEYFNMSLKNMKNEYRKEEKNDGKMLLKDKNRKASSDILFFTNQLSSIEAKTTASDQQQKTFEPKPSTSSGVVEDQNSKENELKLVMLQEMFPDFGDGFLHKCLEYFDFNNERVVDAIFENNLPPDLERLDRSLKKETLLKQTKSIHEDATKFDPVLKTEMQLSDIYIGKKNKLNEVSNDSETREMKAKTLALMDKIEDEEETLRETVKNLLETQRVTKTDLEKDEKFLGLTDVIYNDEYDDTYEDGGDTFDLSFDENLNNDTNVDYDQNDNDDDGYYYNKNNDSNSKKRQVFFGETNRSAASNTNYQNENLNRNFSNYRNEAKSIGFKKFAKRQNFDRHYNEKRISSNNQNQTQQQRRPSNNNNQKGNNNHHPQQHFPKKNNINNRANFVPLNNNNNRNNKNDTVGQNRKQSDKITIDINNDVDSIGRSIDNEYENHSNQNNDAVKNAIRSQQNRNSYQRNNHHNSAFNNRNNNKNFRR